VFIIHCVSWAQILNLGRQAANPNSRVINSEVNMAQKVKQGQNPLWWYDSLPEAPGKVRRIRTRHLCYNWQSYIYLALKQILTGPCSNITKIVGVVAARRHPPGTTHCHGKLLPLLSHRRQRVSSTTDNLGIPGYIYHFPTGTTCLWRFLLANRCDEI
jgi:hypothetical protein